MVSKENIDTAQLSLLTMESVPEDADAILAYAPASDLSLMEQDMLRAYLQGGGKLYLITAPAQEAPMTNLETLMAEYGVTAQPGIAVESSQSNYLWGRPYYLLPELGSHAIVDPLAQNGYRVLLPIAHGLSVAQELRAGLTVTPLATTSDVSFSKVAGYSLTTYDKEQGDVDGPFALAVAITEGDTQIIWVSSPMVLDEETNSMISGGNLDFFLNGLNWMCEKDESTLSIRVKSMSRPYLDMDSRTALILTAVVVALIPALYLGIGVSTWVKRRRK
jgi:ABC-2 type transport system permease protein